MSTAQAFDPVLSRSSKKDTQREYETVTILQPSTNRSEILELVKRVQGVLTKANSRLLTVENWGIRILAYPVAKNTKGIYIYWRFLGGSTTVAELERNLRIYEGVVRWYTVRTDDDVDPGARPGELTEELLDAVGDSGPDPEVLAAKRAAEEAAAQAAAEAAEAAAAAERAEEEAASQVSNDTGGGE